jgi:hypothetical protein
VDAYNQFAFYIPKIQRPSCALAEARVKSFSLLVSDQLLLFTKEQPYIIDVAQNLMYLQIAVSICHYLIEEDMSCFSVEEVIHHTLFATNKKPDVKTLQTLQRCAAP